jgi:riboflavin kinase/FMN adenylyltransferase
MRTFASGDPTPPGARGVAVALGNFDGVHLGHQAVVRAAAAQSLPLSAAVFEPHPRRYFQPDAPPFRLQSQGQRARALEALGVQILHVLAFDRAMADRGDAEFAREILVDRIGAAHVAVGFDFRFGHDRVGDAARLQALGAQYGFSVEVVDAVDDSRHAGKVSSSEIRAAVQAGDADRAASLLGRPWAIEGAVIDGFKRARGIGFPTANVGLADYVRPRFGVYATRTDTGDGVWRAGVSNIGVKPTVGGVSEPLVETHVFDWSGHLYGRTVETQVLKFLRPEQKFESFEALTAQIAQDADEARAVLA